MRSNTIYVRTLFALIYSLLAVALSCTDHEVPGIPNDPESACLKINGSPRLYPCEFKIEKLTFYAKDNSVLGEVTPGSPAIALSRSKAKMDSNPGASTAGQIGSLIFDVKATVKRLASPSFPVSAGYLLVYSSHVSGPLALTTPGESAVTGSPVAISIPVGATTEITFELPSRYELYNTMSGVKPKAFLGLTAFLIYNDATSAALDEHPSLIGDVAESYIRITTTVGE
ncbi:hypothetical protein LZD49_26705 [Dyadobacter sp. CY261]|uniref:hypothetical protein n=1 Tax=Dyadobacter sp. CY261 TaxID=2907203 RepID=UPI001F247B04|nr:hypothetical protein [Dyadobacter sp. CY261]MCF0074102.1 hypothetical protein [Dyadobacter sp. CY261]